MITEVTDLGDGIEGYRTFTLAFSPGAKLVHKLAAGGPLTLSKPKSHLTIPMRDSEPFHATTPVADVLNDDGQGTHCTLNSVANAARCGDYGLAQDMGSVMKPDTKIRGVPCWRVGDSANNATAILAAAWKARQETLQDNRKIKTGHSL